MASEADNPAPDDGIPVLREVVQPGDPAAVPVLTPEEAVAPGLDGDVDGGLTPERLVELADTLQLTLSRELDYAIDGAVYERLQNAMEEVAASVKRKVQAQLEQKLPELIEQTLGKER
jgi:hypothetical protein